MAEPGQEKRPLAPVKVHIFTLSQNLPGILEKCAKRVDGIGSGRQRTSIKIRSSLLAGNVLPAMWILPDSAGNVNNDHRHVQTPCILNILYATKRKLLTLLHSLKYTYENKFFLKVF